MDCSGATAGRIKGNIGDGYVEIERAAGSWFVPRELLEAKDPASTTIKLTSEQVRAIDIERLSTR